VEASGLRNRIIEAYEKWVHGERFGYFLDRIVQPEDDLAGEWERYLAFSVAVRNTADARLAEVLARLDTVDGPIVEADLLPAQPVWDRLAAAAAVRTRFHEERFSDNERLSAALNGYAMVADDAPPDLGELTRQRRARARRAAELRSFEVWRSAQPRGRSFEWAPGQRDSIQRRAAEALGGVELPDSLYEFWAFLQRLGPVEQDVLATDLGLFPTGVLDLFDHPDARTVLRYRAAPPELVPYLGTCWGAVHCGLWFDGPTYVGVCRFDRDFPEIGSPTGTPFDAVRDAIENAFDAIDGEDPDWAEPWPDEFQLRRHRLDLLRVALP
jgi:hypothetical protein